MANRWPGRQVPAAAAGYPGAAPDDGISGRSAGPLPEGCRRVLEALVEETDPVPVEQLHEALGMSLLEVADAVRDLRQAGLAEVIRSGMDDLVRPSDAGRAEAGRSGGGRP